MIYKHDYFILDAGAKKVFDENGKELRLTGNAYRLLVFLCENKSANLTEINDYLDWAKDYSEDHIRQYRYKINTIVGQDIVEYKNGIYYLVGEIKKADSLEIGQRNTDLLREESIKSEKDIMDKIKNIKLSIIPAIIAIVLLLLSFLDWPYGYYTFLRVVVTIVAIYYAYYLYETIKELNFWFWGSVIIAILFNPIIPIHLGDKAVWGVIDVIVAIFFVCLIIKFKKK